MSKFETSYKDLIEKIISNGHLVDNRTGVPAMQLFNQQININLKDGFPIITGKKIFFLKAYHEYMWIREGMTTTKYLNDHDIKWWDKYAKPDGDLGRTYGYQLRNYNGNFDQLAYVIKEIKQGSRRAHITMWNPSDLEYQSLPCCYTSFNFVRTERTLSMSMDFRSSDVFLGLPYDIVVGALLLIDVAEFTGLTPVHLGINLSNAHLYANHEKQIKDYLKAETHKLPIYVNSFNDPVNKLINYKHSKFIQAPLNE